ncbi:phage tail tape measure protein [Burkholderia sp. Bp9015]|uniref:phage tail tape measure protein n=1 Tax=Burkholderia sp. Bp9015 TaxID=2184563 RepID=UPI000F5B264B|nr:hypothetical protein [Burkholderia sp. Bp9015]RQR78678.1 hypothetical protein DIE12_03200 [Burkholderia sp. Bp9015]
MDKALQLRVMFDMIDNITKPMKTMLAGSKGLASALKDTRRELAEMQKAQKDVASFRQMRTGLDATGKKLAEARTRVKELAAAVRSTDQPTEKMVADLNAAREASRKLSQQHKQQTAAVNELRTRLQTAGVDTQNLSRHERDLRTSITSTTAAMNAQAAKLDQISQREKRVNAARASMNRLQSAGANMAVTGYAARSSGERVLGGLFGTLDEAKKMTNERARITALGLGDHATADAEKYVRAMKMMGVSTSDNMTLMRDALSIFADEHHAQMVMPTLAKMKFANEALFGAEDAHANEEKFMNMLKVIELRGGTKDEATFKNEANMVQKVLSATGGRVGGDEWRNFIQTGGVAAKQMRQDAFYYQMEPLIQEMGGHAVGTGLMSAYSNLYQGKTTVRAAKQMMALGLLDGKKVEYNKIGMIKQIRPGALAGGDLLKASPLEWIEQVLLPKFAAKGIKDPEKIKDMISTIITNRTAANLFTTMYMQGQQIHKNERLNRGAYGIDESARLGALQTQGKENDALAKARDLRREIGERIAPLYNAALDKTREVLTGLIGLIQRHGAAAKVILSVLAAIAALLVVMGTFTIALAGMLGPLAVLRFSMTMLGMQGGILSRVLGFTGAAIRLVGASIAFVGRALLLNPIGLAITGIALAAFLIYEYWEPIKAFFGDLWGQVRAAFDGGLSGIGALILNWSPIGLFYQAFAAVMSWFGIELPAKFSTFGSNLMTGLVDGITSGLGTVKDAIVNVADSTVGWFKEKLGIHSPSRVFGELGGFIGQGAAMGIEGEGGRVARAAISLATVAATSFAAPPVSAAPIVRPTVPFDSRAPLSAAPAGAQAAATAPATYPIHIYAAPGMDPQAIARAVTAELDRREREQRARRTSSLSDHE